MIVVADASPLIFLAKLRQLELLRGVVGEDIRIPEAVRNEVLAPPLDPREQRVLEVFLRKSRVEPVLDPVLYATAMSQADNAALTLAVRLKADLLLCDEKVMRTMAEAEGIRPFGTLGILMRALRMGVLDRKRTRRLLDMLVADHGFRIIIELYQAVLAKIDQNGP